MILLRELQDPQGLRALLEHQHGEEARVFEGGHLARKRGFGERLLIDAERHLSLIKGRVRKIYETEAAIEAISNHVTNRGNLIRRLADRVAIAYDVPPTRRLRDTTEEKQRAFIEAYKEAHTDLIAPMWGRYAWLCNIVHVVPRIELGKLVWVTILPHNADVVWDPAGEARPSILVFESQAMGAKRIAVDAERWWWIDEGWRLIDDEEHGIGSRPWAEFRVEAPPPGDYWDRGRGRGLVDGTLEIGRIAAHMSWARKVQSKKAAYIFVGADDDMPPGQLLNGEDPLFARGGNINVGLLDLITPVDDFLKEIRAIFEDAAEAEGVPGTVVDFEPRSTDDAANVFAFAGPRTHETLVKKRNRQIKHLGAAEMKAAESAGELMLRAGHPAGIAAEEVKKTLRVQFGDLNFADHPAAQMRTAKEQMSLGQTNPFEVYAGTHQGTTEAEAVGAVLANVEATARFHDIQASRNLPGQLPEEDGIKSLPQEQGQQGGLKAAENTPEGNDATQP